MFDRFVRLVGLVAAIAIGGVGCVAEAPDSVRRQDARFAETVELPAPALDGPTSLEESLSTRRSQRGFIADDLSDDVVAQLFWAGQGITDEEGHRTAPSAGARYPLELYMVTSTSVAHYLPELHGAERRTDTRTLERLDDASFGQDFVSEAPAVLVITAVGSRTEAEYGAVAPELVNREAGHAAQNILLQASALDLAAVPVGGFDPAALGELLALPPGEEVLYLIPIGYPDQPADDG
jgi:SagB-type dehydrogenase family enzyme